MKIDFIKNPMFKKIIQTRSEDGVILTTKKWLEYASKNGHLDKKEADKNMIKKKKRKIVNKIKNPINILY
jgi:hypothetical protein